jgi:hypothetical protein
VWRRRLENDEVIDILKWSFIFYYFSFLFLLVFQILPLVFHSQQKFTRLFKGLAPPSNLLIKQNFIMHLLQALHTGILRSTIIVCSQIRKKGFYSKNGLINSYYIECTRGKGMKKKTYVWYLHCWVIRSWAQNNYLQ